MDINKLKKPTVYSKIPLALINNKDYMFTGLKHQLEVIQGILFLEKEKAHQGDRRVHKATYTKAFLPKIRPGPFVRELQSSTSCLHFCGLSYGGKRITRMVGNHITEGFPETGSGQGYRYLS